jgi:glutathione synthase/RimK-type ligase-like ATP-grasp enzyme
VRRIALVTCAAFPRLHDDDRLLLAPLRERGFEPDVVRWDDDSVAWDRYDAVVLRSTWDYVERIDAFRDWLDVLEERGARIWNPPAIVRDNLDKTYLRRLEAAGVPVVPTVWLERGDPRRPAEIADSIPWEDVVVKPSVGAGAFRTHRTTRRDLAAGDASLAEILRTSRALVQPFLREVVEDGEWSFVYLGDRFSHAALKRAKPGDFRVQWTHGGRHEGREPSAALARAADDVFRRLPGGCLYTRVDGAVVGGRFLLMELERVEPYLFLAESPGAPDRFVDALESVLR